MYKFKKKYSVLTEESLDTYFTMEVEIDAESLISLVSENPVIWDKAFPDYQSRDLSSAAWRKICSQLDSDYNGMSEVEKHEYGHKVMKKWRNIRDQYIKACKKAINLSASGNKLKKARPYIYHRELAFLDKSLDLHETQSEVAAEPPKTPSVQKNDLKFRHHKETTVDIKPLKRPKMEFEDRSSDTHPENDPKLYFFKSILPSLRDFTDDEMLQFQSGIISLVQDIKRNRHSQVIQLGNTAYMPISSPGESYIQDKLPITSGYITPDCPQKYSASHDGSIHDSETSCLSSGESN